MKMRISKTQGEWISESLQENIGLHPSRMATVEERQFGGFSHRNRWLNRQEYKCHMTHRLRLESGLNPRFRYFPMSEPIY